MKSLSVFCGSSAGDDPAFIDAARLLGRTMAEAQMTVVYGGAKVGLMGAVADAALGHGGKVIGVLPEVLQGKEIAHTGLTELILCKTMHERKTKMFELSEGFIALPGGFGTLEEVMEILTWQQLGLHKYPVGILNVNGYYDHLRLLFEEMERKKLLRPDNKRMAIFGDDIPALLAEMKAYKAPDVPKWVSKATT